MGDGQQGTQTAYGGGEQRGARTGEQRGGPPCGGAEANAKRSYLERERPWHLLCWGIGGEEELNTFTN